MKKQKVHSEIYSLREEVIRLRNENQNLRIMARQYDGQNVAMIAGLFKTKKTLLEILDLCPNAITELETFCQEKENMLQNETPHQEIEMLLRHLKILMKYLLLSDEAGKRETEATKKREEPQI